MQVKLAVGDIGCPLEPASIRGIYDDSPQDLWVAGGKSRVSASGAFLIPGLNFSTYLVLIIRGDTVLHQEVVSTFHRDRAAALSIDLRRTR